MNTVQILKDARALIADEKNWTQNVMGRTSEGQHVDVHSPEASCFCVMGALLKVTGGRSEDEFWLARREFYRGELKVESIAHFNDTHSHGEVIDLFDRVIARAESEAAR